jgi:hypothetical protein
MCSLSSFGNNETKLELKDDKTSYMFHAPVHQISNHILQTQGNAATHTMCDDSQRALFASKCHIPTVDSAFNEPFVACHF